MAIANETINSICTLPICDIPARITEFRNLSQPQRFSALQGYQTQASQLSQAAALRNLAQFGHAVHLFFVEIQEEDWMIRAADTVESVALFNLLKAPDSTIESLTDGFNQLGGDDPKGQILRYWAEQIPTITDKERLKALNRFLLAARDAVQTGAADWVQREASSALDAVARQLLGLPDLSSEDRGFFFRQISSSSLRADLINQWIARSEQASEATALEHFRALFTDVVAACAQSERWVLERARNGLEAITLKIIKLPQQSVDRMLALYNTLGDDSRLAILRHFSQQITLISDRDRSLDLNRFFHEIAQQANTTSANWIQREAIGASDSSAQRLLSQPNIAIAQASPLFRQIQSNSVRHEVLLQWITKIEGATQAEELLQLRAFFQAAVTDSASFERWVLDRARNGLDAVSAKLIRTPTAPIDDLISYFADLGDDSRVAALRFWIQQINATEDRTKAMDLNRFFLAAAQACASSPEWVQREASSQIDASARRLLTGFTLSPEEGERFYRQITNDQSRDNILVAMTARAARADTDDLLIFIHSFFAAAVRLSGQSRDLLDRAQIGLRTVNSKLIRRPQVNADEMTIYFSELDSEQVRNDVLTFWRSRLRRYNDAPSLLQLARFFYLAGQNCRTREMGDWVINTALIGESEVTAKIGTLFPLFEGIYQLQIQCASASPCAPSIIQRLVIMNDLSAEGLSVSFINGATDHVVFHFNNARISHGVTSFDAIANANGTLSQLHMDFDTSQRTIQGFIRNSDRSEPLRFTARQSASLATLFERHPRRNPTAQPLASSQLNRIFRGNLAGRTATLSVRSLTSSLGVENIGATLSFDGVNHSTFHFQSGRLDPQAGVLTLLGSMPNSGLVKLTLILSQDPEFSSITADGLSFSSVGDSVRSSWFFSP